MFKSFFPKAGAVLYFGIYLGTGRRCILASRWGAWLHILPARRETYLLAQRVLVVGLPDFYAYYILCVGVFALFWFLYSPHRWQYWSILGTSLIIL